MKNKLAQEMLVEIPVYLFIEIVNWFIKIIPKMFYDENKD